MVLAACLAVVGLLGALTSSEREQVRHFVATARPESAARARALVARTDNTAQESFGALRDAFVPVPFDDARAAFARELVFGGASASARPTLAPAVARALLARADAVYGKSGAEPDAAELVRIYAFLAGDVAGKRGPQSGIPDASYEECAQALAEHVTGHAAALGPNAAALSPAMFRARAQAHLALLDLVGDSPTRRLDLADRLGLTGTRRAILAELGVLVVDGVRGDDPRLAKLKAVLARLPGARASVDAIVLGAERGALRSRSSFVAVKAGLDARETAGAAAEALAWGDEVEPSPERGAMAEVTLELATAAVRRALDRRGDLRVVAEADARAAAGDPARTLGRPTPAPAGVAPDAAATLAPAVALLALDAPRVVDLAAARASVHATESAAILSDALGVLAAHAPPGDATSGLALALGKAGADGVTARFVQLAPTGVVNGFVLEAVRWEITRDAAGRVTGMRRNGATPTIAVLPTARVPLASGTVWQEGKTVFARLTGAPRAGLGPPSAKGEGVRVRLVGSGGRLDAIGTPAPGADVAVELDLRVSGEPGGVVVRAQPAGDKLRGASLMLTATTPARAALTVDEGDGKEVELATAELPTAASYKVRVVVRGQTLAATVGPAKLTATLPPALSAGDIALRTRRTGTVEVYGFDVTRSR